MAKLVLHKNVKFGHHLGMQGDFGFKLTTYIDDWVHTFEMVSKERRRAVSTLASLSSSEDRATDRLRKIFDGLREEDILRIFTLWSSEDNSIWPSLLVEESMFAFSVASVLRRFSILLEWARLHSKIDC